MDDSKPVERVDIYKKYKAWAFDQKEQGEEVSDILNKRQLLRQYINKINDLSDVIYYMPVVHFLLALFVAIHFLMFLDWKTLIFVPILAMSWYHFHQTFKQEAAAVAPSTEFKQEASEVRSQLMLIQKHFHYLIFSFGIIMACNVYLFGKIIANDYAFSIVLLLLSLLVNGLVWYIFFNKEHKLMSDLVANFDEDFGFGLSGSH